MYYFQQMRLYIQHPYRAASDFYKHTFSTADGQVIYKIITPSRLKRKAYVYRNVLSLPLQPPPPSAYDKKESVPEAPSTVDLEEDGQRYTKVGAVHFHAWSPTTITIGDRSFTEHELFGKVRRYYREYVVTFFSYLLYSSFFAFLLHLFQFTHTYGSRWKKLCLGN